MATILGESPSKRFDIRRGAQQDVQLRAQEKSLLNPGSNYSRDTFPMPFADFDVNTQYGMSDAGKADKKRMQGGNNGTVNGASTTGTLNAGTNIKADLLPEQSDVTGTRLGMSPVINKLTPSTDPNIEANRIGASGRGDTTYTSRFGSDPMIHTLSGNRVPLQTVNENRYVAGNNGGNPSLGDNVFTDTNVDKAALAKSVNIVDSDAMSRLMGNDSGGSKGGGGGGNQGNSIDDQVDQINHQRMLEDFKKQKERDSYEQDLKDYYSGDLRSSGYGRIRSENMDLQSKIDDIMRIRGVAHGPLIEAAINEAGANRRARLGLDAEQVKAGSNESINAANNQQEAAAAQLQNMNNQQKQAFEQEKEAERRRQAIQSFGLEERKFGLESEKATADRQYKLGQLGLDEAKLSQSQAELGLKASDYASQAEKRKADIMLGQTEGLRKAYETGQEPIKNAANITKLEGGMATQPAAARVRYIQSLGLDPALIDPEGWAEVQQQTGK